MILNELQFIKNLSAQSSKSTVTAAEIAQKEAELGIKLPEALCDLYLSFTPEDDVFKVGCSLVPFSELCLTKFKSKYHINTLLIFMRNESKEYGVLLRQENIDTGHTSNYCNIDNQWVASHFKNPKNKSDRKTLYVDTATTVAQWIIRCIGYQKIYTLSNIMAVHEKMSITEDVKYWANFDDLYDHSTSLHISQADTNILGIAQPWDKPLIEVPHYNCIWGADAVEPLEQLAQHDEHEYVWLKRDGKIQVLAADESTTKNKQTQIKNEDSALCPNIQYRSLYSIEPILQYLSNFASLEKECDIENKLLKKEAKLNVSFPIPFREYYQYMPKSIYKAYNSHYPIYQLRADKTGKIKFLVENEEIYHCAIDPNTPYVYFKMADQRGDWLPWGILDGYLVGEFVWNMACSDTLNLDVVRFKGFSQSMIGEGGILYPYLSDIANGLSAKVAEGNFFRVYQIIENKVIALHEKSSQQFYFIANDHESLNSFISSANIKL